MPPLVITRPTLLVDANKVRRNIARMVQRAHDAQVVLRPHFKTHQCAAIGEWCREAGIERITVSSLEMAVYFAEHGWRDITVAIPCNVAQMDLVQQLAARIQLGIVVDSLQTVAILKKALQHKVHIWIKIDVGYGRAGIPWNDTHTIAAVARSIVSPSPDAQQLQFVGLLTHAGHSYSTNSHDALRDIAHSSLQRLRASQRVVMQTTAAACLLSSGDTPTLSSGQAIDGIDEIRPGNFVFHDVMQLALGSCEAADIAVAVACPIIALYPHRNEVLVYGGAAHFSKDSLRPGTSGALPGLAAHQEEVFGLVVEPPGNSAAWGSIRPDAVLSRLSQEHGILRVENPFLDLCQVGKPLYFLPIHSCLTADLYPAYQTLEGAFLQRFRSNDPVGVAR